MKKYKCHKIVEAEPQTKNNILGYKVVYADGYVSWSPKKAFEDGYTEIKD